MKLKQSMMTFLTLSTLFTSSALIASDFDWMVSLNLRSHSDPYSYRYGLIDRFGYRESEVIYILDSVREPADAYMIFRLAELSNRPPEYILGLYCERRFVYWDDYAFFLGIRDRPSYRELHYHHDIVYRKKPQVRYEEHHYVEPHHKVYPEKRVIVEPRQEQQHTQSHTVTQKQPYPPSQPDNRNVSPNTKRYDQKHDSHRDDRDNNDRDRH